MKYAPCCNSICLLSHCETRESGGCYCVCLINDHINSLQKLINGESVAPFIFFEDKSLEKIFYDKNKNTCDKYINEAPLMMQKAKEILKKYEIIKE